MFLQHLRLACWNTALSSSARTVSTDLLRCIDIVSHIESLFNDLRCDFVALSEVCSADLDIFRKLLNPSHKIIDLASSVGKTRFDCAVIYNENLLSVDKIKDLSLVDLGNTIKTGQVVSVKEKITNDEFIIVLCHWSSQIMTSGIDKRNNAAKHLQSYLEPHLRNGDKVIVMGDFNDEPYSSALVENLYATRCIDAVRKHPTQLLYNPFWRYMVCEELYSHSNDTKSFESGTYSYTSYTKNFWKMYDQIIFSSSFLGSSCWHINEQETTIVKSQSFRTSFSSKNSSVDHYPVICEILKP